MSDKLSRLIGRGWAFPPQIDSRGNLSLTSGDAEIQQSIHIILSTAIGERVMRPDFGCRIHELVFAPNNNATQSAAKRYIREALGRWEPRIQVKDIRTIPDPTNMAGILMIEIDYVVKASQDPRSLVLPFYLLPDQE